MTVAAIDLGSTITKGARVSADLRLEGVVAEPTPTPTPGQHLECDPTQLVSVAQSVLETALSGEPTEAIAITTQRSTCLVWDRETRTPLTPAISWQDRSELERVQEWKPEEEAVRQRTGLPLSPHYAAPKMAALFDRFPELVPRARAGEVLAGTLDAFLLHHLTGEPSTDPTHAGRTLLFDLEEQRWSAELGEVFGIPLECLPPISPSGSPRGTFRGVPVLCSLGDQQAALLAHGGWSADPFVVHLGTGAFVLSAARCSAQRSSALLHAVLASTAEEIRCQVEGAVLSAGTALDWVQHAWGGSLDPSATARIDPRRLPWFLPALNGLGAPWWKPDAVATFSEEPEQHSPDDLVAAALAGVAMRVLDCVEAIDENRGERDRPLRLSGRLAQIPSLAQLLADVGQRPVGTTAEADAGIVGAAQLAFAVQNETTTPLAKDLPIERHHQPRWPRSRAETTRRAWQEFVDRCLDRV